MSKVMGLNSTLNVDENVLAQVKHLLGEDGYARTFAPIEEASGLANAAYWSEEWLKLEQEQVFRRSWVFAGATAEIPKVGDIKPIEIGGAPLILVRESADKIIAMHNVCRHRGAKLITEKCHKRNIVCPYHAWNYKLDGTLFMRPHFEGPDIINKVNDPDNDKINLVQTRTEVWNGCIFVNISGDAEPLAEWLKPMLKRTQQYDFSKIRWAGKIEFEVKANWKLVYENYMEGYHVFTVHPKLLKFAPMNLRWSGEWDAHVFYNDYVAPKLEDGRGESLPNYAGLTDEEARRGLWFLCFPHFAAEVFADQFSLLVSYPIAPNLTREELHVFVVNDEAMGAEYDGARKNLLQMWDDLNREDIGMLELLQQGRLSPAYDGGRLSPHWEQPTHDFGKRIVEKIIAR